MTLNFLEKYGEMGNKQQLQDDIDKLIKWSEKWQIVFNFENVKAYTQGMEMVVKI